MRDGRARFVARALPLLVTAIGLLLYTLNQETAGGASRYSTPLNAALAVLCLLAILPFAVRRGRDLGWPAWGTLAALFFGTSLGPLLLIALGMLFLKRGDPDDNRFGPPPAPLHASSWVFSLLVLVLPWAIAIGAQKLRLV